MRYVVTGAAGFLGSHLVERLLAGGHDVLGIDNLVTGRPRNLARLESHPSFSFLEHNVAQFIAVEGAVDGVFHFASPASPADYLGLPIQTLKVGSLGTTPWGLPRRRAPASCSPRRLRYTGIRRFTPSRRTTGGT